MKIIISIDGISDGYAFDEKDSLLINQEKFYLLVKRLATTVWGKYKDKK